MKLGGRRIDLYMYTISRIGSAERFVRRRVGCGFEVVRLSRLSHSLLSKVSPENAQQLNSPQSSFVVRPWLYIFVFISSAARILAIVLNWTGKGVGRSVLFILILHDLVTFAGQQLLWIRLTTASMTRWGRCPLSMSHHELSTRQTVTRLHKEDVRKAKSFRAEES